jgi:hypothetical protein
MTRHSRWAAAVPPALLVLCALLATSMTACTRGHPRAAASASAAAVSHDQVLAIGRRFAACVRAHGVPGFPDPVLNGDYLELPADASGNNPKVALQANPAAQQACDPILRELPPSAVRSRAPRQVNMQKLLRFAQCMRQHGVPNWPDPDANGDFPLAQAGITQIKSPSVVAGFQACKQFDDGSIGVK